MVHLVSEDVLHSFYIPTLRIKKDIVPGMTTKAWFEADPVQAPTIFSVRSTAAESTPRCGRCSMCSRSRSSRSGISHKHHSELIPTRRNHLAVAGA